MRVVVVGGTGNVGSCLVEQLAQDPEVESVVALSRREPEELPARVDWRHVDVSVDVPADLFQGADAVVHLAWLFQPTRRPTTTWEANVEGSRRVFEAAAEAGVRVLVHASSVGTYSARVDENPVDESWPTDGIPVAAYSREKAYVERMLDVFERDHPGTRVVRMRPAFIFRREAAVEQRRLFLGPFTPARLLVEHAPLVPDPGGLLLQAVHTEDVARAYRLALTREVAGAFNIAAGPTLDMHDVAGLMGVPAMRVPAGLTRAALAAAWRARLVPASPGLFEFVRRLPMMRTDRARDVLGWEAAYTAQDAVRALLEGLREGTGGPTPPLAPRTSGFLRRHELGTGVGTRP